MYAPDLDPRLVAAFIDVLRRCGVEAGHACTVLAESQSRPVLVNAARFALESLDAYAATLTVPSPRLAAPAPVRSTGASDALQRFGPVVSARSRPPSSST